mgnify:CR=1 FL=1
MLSGPLSLCVDLFVGNCVLLQAIDLELEKDRRRKAKLRMREGAATPAHGPGSPDADDAGQGVPARGVLFVHSC